MTEVETIDAASEDFEPEFEARGRWTYARRRFTHNRFAMASVIVLVVVITAGFLAPKIAPYSYHELNISALSRSPSWSHPFGTDENGRDYFSRVLYGIGTSARVMLLVGFFGTMLGVLAGGIAGFYMGWLDNLLMRFTDAMLAVPAIALMLTASAYIEVRTPVGVSLLLALILWPPIARIVRAGALSLREKEYVEAARAVGASDLTILFRHVLPNLIGVIAVAATLLASSAVLFEAALTFLGFGGGTDVFGHIVSTHAPSLGNVLNEAQQAGPNQWWGETFPGLAIVLIVVCINIVGEGLRDALEPAPRRVVVAPSRRRRIPGSKAIGRAAEVAMPVARKPVVATARFASAAVDRIPVPRLRRERSGRRILLETLVVVGVLAIGAGAIYKATVHHIRSAWPVAGLDVRDVSRDPGVQSEASVAIDPASPHVLLAGSNNGVGGVAGFENTLVYRSTDGGAHWSSSSGPDPSAYACGQGDPAVTIDTHGHEYYAFLLSPACTEDSQSSLLVAQRNGSAGRWHLTRVARQSYAFGFDDKPALAVDRRGRVYVVWRRLLSDRYATFVISHSDDAGRNWTRPVVVDRALSNPVLPGIAIGSRGEVYIAGLDARLGVWLARSRNGGRTFQIRQAAALPGNQAGSCATEEGRPVAGEAYRCLGPDPTVSSSARRVYVTYASGGRIFVSVFDRALHRLANDEVAATQAGNRFWPVSATDAVTGELWVCFYDTNGDSARTRAWFVCTVSSDGRSWASPLRVARSPSSVDALWSDATLSGFDDQIYYGGYAGLAASGGTAYPLWIDTSGTRGEEVYSVNLPVRAFGRSRP